MNGATIDLLIARIRQLPGIRAVLAVLSILTAAGCIVTLRRSD